MTEQRLHASEDKFYTVPIPMVRIGLNLFRDQTLMSEILVRLLRYSYEKVAFSFFKENEEKANMNNQVKRKFTLENVFTKDIEVHEVKNICKNEIMEEIFLKNSSFLHNFRKFLKI